MCALKDTGYVYVRVYGGLFVGLPLRSLPLLKRKRLSWRILEVGLSLLLNGSGRSARPLHTISLVPCSVVKTARVLRQCETRTRSGNEQRLRRTQRNIPKTTCWDEVIAFSFAVLFRHAEFLKWSASRITVHSRKRRRYYCASYAMSLSNFIVMLSDKKDNFLV